MSGIIDLDLNNISVENIIQTTQLSLEDALVKSLNEFGRVNMRWICECSNLSLNTVLTKLNGLIFQNPETWNEDDYEGYETKDEYLSGNIFNKLISAIEANDKYKGRFASNIKELRKIYDSYHKNKSFYVTLGSPWIPKTTINDFLIYLSGTSKWFNSYVSHDTHTGSWFIQNKRPHNARLYSTFGTKKMYAFEIVEDLLNNKTIEVTKKAYVDGKEVTVPDLNETLLANEKANLIKEEFNKWIFSSKERSEVITNLYNSIFGTYNKREYDGSFLTFPEMNHGIELRKYQKDAIARMILSKNTLLAHDTGSGKTYEMIAAGEEMLRMGLSSKNLYVVPNNILSDWKKSFNDLYPNAKVYVVEPAMFNPANINKTLATIASDTYSAVVMPCSVFDRIKLSKQSVLNRMQEQIKELENSNRSYATSTRMLKIKLNALKKQYEKLFFSQDKEPDYTFEKLGFTRMFVDEAHAYKNLSVGDDHTFSEKCENFLDKLTYIQKINDGKGVVLATATPITNSISELFVMQYYLQRGELKLLGLDNFNAWISNFAEREDVYELSVKLTDYKLTTRYTKFHNLKELENLLSYVIDFHKSEDANLSLPTCNGYVDTVIPKNPYYDKFLARISKRADDIQHYRVDRKQDNYLKITNDGRKSAIDLRLVSDEGCHYYHANNKINACVDNVYKLYTEHDDTKATQLIFSDISVPSDTWNVYEDIKMRLHLKGIPNEHIAFIQDYDTPRKRESLFKAVNRGDVRILLGSTAKLGTGVNVQERLIAIHHLDVPWRPSDFTQRNGRIVRIGNTNKEVFIYRYIMQGSFDSFLWQTLERKQRFIYGLLDSSGTENDGDDIGDVALDYAEIKAIAVGDKRIKEKFQTENEIARLTSLDRKEEERMADMQQDIVTLTKTNEDLEKRIALIRKDVEYFDSVSDMYQDRQTEKDIVNDIFIQFYDNVKFLDEYKLPSLYNFEIAKPYGVQVDKYFIRITNNAEYLLEVGQSNLGLYTRFENFFNGLKDLLKKEYENLEKNTLRINTLAAYKPVFHKTKINELKKKLEVININI